MVFYNMSIAKIFLISLLSPKSYIWVDVVIIKNTQKAILVMFDGRKIWLPKAWIIKITKDQHANTAKIKISEYLWAQKSQ